MSDAVTPFQAPIGTHDVLAPKSAEWEGVVATFAQFAYRYGFELVITPMFEDVGRLQPRHRRGERRRQEGDVRLQRPR